MGFFEFSINLRIYVKFLWEFLGKKKYLLLCFYRCNKDKILFVYFN